MSQLETNIGSEYKNLHKKYRILKLLYRFGLNLQMF